MSPNAASAGPFPCLSPCISLTTALPCGRQDQDQEEPVNKKAKSKIDLQTLERCGYKWVVASNSHLCSAPYSRWLSCFQSSTRCVGHRVCFLSPHSSSPGKQRVNERRRNILGLRRIHSTLSMAPEAHPQGEGKSATGRRGKSGQV